jgi:acyl-homoserine lactone acylase PvdQ
MAESDNVTGKDMLDYFNEQTVFPLNFVFVTKSGDIGYKMCGSYPRRKYNVVQGSYAKKGWLKEN